MTIKPLTLLGNPLLFIAGLGLYASLLYRREQTRAIPQLDDEQNALLEAYLSEKHLAPSNVVIFNRHPELGICTMLITQLHEVDQAIANPVIALS